MLMKVEGDEDASVFGKLVRADHQPKLLAGVPTRAVGAALVLAELAQTCHVSGTTDPW